MEGKSEIEIKWQTFSIGILCFIIWLPFCVHSFRYLRLAFIEHKCVCYSRYCVCVYI